MAVSTGLLAPLPTNYEYYTSGGISQGLSIDQPYFTLNDKLIQIYSGAMHYFRIPRAYWRDRLKKIRAAGFNTVETYVPWNLHEPEPGNFDFGNGGSDYEDFLHLDEFLNTAKEEDLFVIMRSGPFICGEFNFGGFPTWLLREKSMGFRTSEATYMKYVTRYFNVLLTLLAAFQFTQGGPIIAFQVENEYGNQGAPDHEYMLQLKDLMLSNGIVELLATSDSPLRAGDKGAIPGGLQTANLFNNVNEKFDKLEELQPGKPLMAMEFWAGWFDYWGANHTSRSAEETRTYLGDILARNGSFNVYMFVGSSNFAFNNGATLNSILPDNAGLEAVTTSYNYDSALNEYGEYTSKYYVFKEMIADYNPVQTHTPEQPEYVAPISYEPVKLQKVLPFSTLLESNAPAKFASENVMAMEMLDYNNGAGQSNGYIVYRKENIDLEPNSVLTIEGNVYDHVMVLVNEQLVAPKQLKLVTDFEGFGYNKLVNSSVTLNTEAMRGATVDLVVECMGRVNSGRIANFHLSFKGLWNGNVTIDGNVVVDWQIIPLDFKKQWVKELTGWEEFSSGFTSPALYSGVLSIEDNPQDTFLDIRGWGKGTVFVNGFPLGKYAEVGPQQSIYLPAPFLLQGDNEISFFEHFYTPEDKEIKFTDTLLFGDVY